MKTEAHGKISVVLEKIADSKKTLITSVALAYVMQKAPYVFPVIGGRKVEHLKSNIEALRLKLSPEDIAEIENAVPFDIGFPMNLLGEVEGKRVMHPQDVALTSRTGYYDWVEGPRVSLV
jgi:hypothetical protein